MRIGLDGYILSETRTGIGHYTFELSRELALQAADDELQLISPRPFEKDVLGEARLRHPPAANLHFIHRMTNTLTRRWWSVGLPRYLSEAEVNLFHGTNNQVPLFGSCPSVLTIHDLSLLLHPALLPAAAVRRGRFFLPLMACRARRVITPTESVRREIVEHLRVAPERIVAIPEAPRDCFRPLAPDATLEVRRRLGVADDFLLCVATLEPRKNLTRLVAAYEKLLHESDLRFQLVLVGRRGWLVDDLIRRLESDGYGERLRWLGYVTDVDLCALYSSCQLFIYPSLYEGFGLPLLEAMSCGAPVIASRIPSLEEVAGDAAHFVEPTDTQAIVKAIATLWRDDAARHDLATRGLLRAKQFTWKRTVTLTRAVYEQALHETP